MHSRKRNVSTFAFLFLAISSWAACGSDIDDSADPDPGPITYYQHVKPILDAKCAQCHYQGGIGPFSLTSYDDAVIYSGVSKLSIEAGTMPPWRPADDCADYLAPRSLTAEQQATFLEWVDTGMERGDSAHPGAPLDVETTTLSRVDTTLTMDEFYIPVTTPDNQDDYRCFILPWSEEATAYVTGFRAVPGNDAVVHHAIAFLAQPEDAAYYYDLDAAEAGPGWKCFGGTGGPAQEWIGAWAPGGQGAELPPGMGIEVAPGSLIILQMHYNTLNVATDSIVAPDRTSLELEIDDQVDKVAVIQPWANPEWLSGSNMLIPANEPDTVHSFAWDPTVFPFSGAEYLEIHLAALHMHLLGTRGRLSIERSDGTSDCLLQIDDWDFDWQDAYLFREPHVLNKGDQLSVECHWDNTLENQPIIGGSPTTPRDVTWGEGSTDEMCVGIFLITTP